MASNHVWVLVASMTTAEKRYFTRDYLKLDKDISKPLFLLLFEELCKMQDYNEDELLAILHPKLNRKNISYTKNYLYEQLCNALIQHNRQNDLEAQVISMLSLLRILRKKNLYKQALKIWKKTNELATEINHYPLLFQLREEYRKLLIYYNPKLTQEILQDNVANNNKYLQEFIFGMQLRQMHTHAILLRRKSHFDLSISELRKINELLENDIMVNEPKESSFFIQQYYFTTKAILLYLKREYECYDLAYRNVLIWQENSQFINYDFPNYLEALYIFYYAAIFTHRLEEIVRLFEHPVNDLITDELGRVYFETLKFLAFNRFYNLTAQYGKVKELLAYFKAHHKYPLRLLNMEYYRTYHIATAISYFVLEDFDEAYYHVKQSLLLYKDQSRKEHFSFAHLFLLLISYEKKESYTYEIQYQSSYSFFHKSKSIHSFEKEILLGINKAWNANSQKEKIEIFKTMSENLKKTRKDTIQRQTFNYFNVPKWLEAKINNVPYKEWVSRNVIPIPEPEK